MRKPQLLSFLRQVVAGKKQVISIVSIFESKMALLASLNNCFAPVTKIAIVIDM